MPGRSQRRRLGPRTLTAALLVGLATGSLRARAADPAPPTGTQPLEFAVVPLVGGDTDIGIGAGAIASMARPARGDLAFRWKLEGAAFISAQREAGAFNFPFQDFFLLFTRKDLLGGRLRAELRAAYTRESNLRYYGLGNASVAPDETLAARDLFTRTHPAARANAEYRFVGPLRLLLGSTYMFNQLHFAPESNVLRDLGSSNPAVRELLLVDREHSLHWLEAGLVYDTRDNEVVPARGQNHRASVRGSPWKTAAMPFRYLGINASFSGFVPVFADESMVLAGRIVGDMQLGDAPFYELSRVSESSAIGGPKFVRGPPGNRYYGKRKVLGNLEVRNSWFEFNLRRVPYRFGTSVFLDAGRVWADVVSRPELDGAGLGLKYGTGLGLRLQKGKNFVLRGDLAWSPDARPIAAYFLASHIF
ncbi:MAG TPA: BamA/TamA family outer membrane protein [Polyangia bacterium]